jgi:hypothetical protein
MQIPLPQPRVRSLHPFSVTQRYSSLPISPLAVVRKSRRVAFKEVLPYSENTFKQDTKVSGTKKTQKNPAGKKI